MLVFVSVLKITFLAKRNGQSPPKKELNKEMVETERETWTLSSPQCVCILRGREGLLDRIS